MSRRATALCTIAVTIVVAGACGKSTAPSGGGSASLQGTLTAGNGSAHARATTAARPAASFTGVTVSVVGSGQQAMVDSNNQFSLSLPSGQVQLQFSGGSANGMVQLTDISAGAAVVATFLVAGGTVTLGSDVISNGGSVEAQGVIDELLTNTSFDLGGVTIVTTTATTIVQGSTVLNFGDLSLGLHVTVNGQQGAGFVQAASIQIN